VGIVVVQEHSVRHAGLTWNQGVAGGLLRRFRHLAKECRGEFSISRPASNFVHQALVFGTKPIFGCLRPVGSQVWDYLFAVRLSRAMAGAHGLGPMTTLGQVSTLHFRSTMKRTKRESQGSLTQRPLGSGRAGGLIPIQFGLTLAF
jgi:hypothetical protein